MATRKVIDLGLRWRVKNGENIKIWRDKWIPTPCSYRIQSPNKLLSTSIIVKELLVENGTTWNDNLNSEIFCEYEMSNILSIPLGKTNQEDKRIWALTENRVFTVKSIYFATLELKSKQREEPSNPTANDSKW